MPEQLLSVAGARGSPLLLLDDAPAHELAWISTSADSPKLRALRGDCLAIIHPQGGRDGCGVDDGRKVTQRFRASYGSPTWLPGS
jgi:hypothetical protein